MAKPKIGKPVTIVVPPEIIAEIDRIAQKRDIAKADVYRMMVKAGIECHKDMERLGVIQTFDFVHYLKDSVRQRLERAGKKQMNLI